MGEGGSERAYSWIFPLIGGLLAIGALFTPAAYHITNDVMYDGIYIWMWGLLVYDGHIYGDILIFQQRPYAFPYNWSSELYGIATSMISTIAILMCGIALVITAKKVKNLQMKAKVASILWIVFSIIMIAAAIFWMVTAHIYYTGMELPYTSQYEEYRWNDDLFKDKDFRFWAYFNPGFGVIGVFIAAGISIIGVLLKSK